MKPTSRRSSTMSSADWWSRSTASRMRSTVARSISPRGDTIRDEPECSEPTSKLPSAATSPSPILALLDTTWWERRSTCGARLDEASSDVVGLLAVQVDGCVHAPHRVSSQTFAERVERPGQPGAVLAGEVRADHRRQVLVGEQVARVLQHPVAAARQLALAREDGQHVDLARVERRVAVREQHRLEAEVPEP